MPIRAAAFADRPPIDLADETFIAAPPARVRDRIASPAFVSTIWPDLEVRVTEERGAEGQRYAVAGGLVGTAEVWLQPWGDGVIAHLYLRAAPPAETWSRRRTDRELRRRRWVAREAMWRIKDELEAGRRPGEPVKR